MHVPHSLGGFLRNAMHGCGRPHPWDPLLNGEFLGSWAKCWILDSGLLLMAPPPTSLPQLASGPLFDNETLSESTPRASLFDVPVSPLVSS